MRVLAACTLLLFGLGQPLTAEEPIVLGRATRKLTIPPPFSQQKLREAVSGIFEAYERESTARFMGWMHARVNLRDTSGNNYDYALLPQALNSDFQILDRIRFGPVQIGTPRVAQSDGKVEVTVRWRRVAWSAVGGKEWILDRQRSVFWLARESTGDYRLFRVFGDAIFGVASRRGQIIARGGTLDGAPIAKPIRLDRFKQPEPVVKEVIKPLARPTINSTYVLEVGEQIDVDTQRKVSSGGDMTWSGDGTIRALGSVRFSQNPPTSPSASLAAVTSVPKAPYAISDITLPLDASGLGGTFAGFSSAGKYFVARISGLDLVSETYTLQVRYQADGGTDFSR